MKTTAQPELYRFEDDGNIPNSILPVIVYRNAFTTRGDQGARWLEERFAENGWTNSWRNGIYPFHHYHSTSHEVLGVYSGSASVQLGGAAGKKLDIQAGDIIILPAGVGHKCLKGEGLEIVGAYPEGRNWDINKGLPGERPKADQNIASLPIPANDPVYGPSGLPRLWNT